MAISIPDNRQRNDFIVIIDNLELNGRIIREFNTDEIVQYLKTINCHYYLIQHIGELDSNTGVVKKSHTHIVIHMVSPRKRRATLINEIMQGLNVPDTEQNEYAFHIDLCNSLFSSVRYLMHLDNPDKSQYGIESVRTNNVDFLNYCYNVDSSKLDYSSLKLICENSEYRPDLIMSVIGLDNFNRYYRCIQALTDTRYYGFKPK